MTTKENDMSKQSVTSKRGWTVVIAGTAINLALGILYAWSILKGAIVDSIKMGGEGAFTWDLSSANDPYAVACLAFAFSMILAGKMQDKFGPRLTAIVGGLMVGGGFIMASQSTNYWTWIAGFGLLFGCGMGFAYSAATPPALRWFPPAKTGLIAGIVVAGFGLAPVYIAPTAKYLLGAYGLQHSMFIFGVAFAIVVSLFAMLLSNPPAGYVADPNAAKSVAKKATVEDMTPSQILKTGKFYTLWATFFIGAGAGLMVIGSAKGLATASMGEWAFLVVAIMSVGNAAGRIVAGLVSDKIGRANTLMIMLAFQAILMFLAIPVIDGTYSNPLAMPLLVTFMVFNYGTNLSLFPSFAKDLWGAKNYGINYGILFSAWGIGAFALVRISEMLKVKTGGFTMSFAAAGALLVVGAMLANTLKTRKAEVPVLEGAMEEEEGLVLSKAANE
jgi:nitrate/nitrite transporter NarK